ncbi:MAG: hypothetical protein NUW08_02565, partial [Candidatus Uhrbacteria bacterium]|nr:hypothetical protein [Candidatus Uhrbacteria bacterium]
FRNPLGRFSHVSTDVRMNLEERHTTTRTESPAEAGRFRRRIAPNVIRFFADDVDLQVRPDVPDSIHARTGKESFAMANDETLNKIAGDHRGSKLARRRERMRFEMPSCTSATAAMYLHQVWLVPACSQRSKDLIIRIELNAFERDEGAVELVKIVGVDDALVSYINDGEFVFRKWGRVRFVRRDGGAAWPERYVLEPTYRIEDLASPGAAKKRRNEIEKAYADSKSPVKTIDLRWSLIEEAARTGKRVDDARLTDRNASLYQAFTGDGGIEMWVARLPHSYKDEPDEDHFIKVPPHRGVAVRLTARFLENLLTVVPAVIEDGLDFATQYYLRRAEESAQDEPDEDEEASDEQDSDD